MAHVLQFLNLTSNIPNLALIGRAAVRNKIYNGRIV